MLVGFKCRKGEVTFEQCFACENPCRPLSFRKVCALKRDVKGYSTTQLIQPTCQQYLKSTVNYYTTPENLEAMIEGSMMHAALEVDLGEDHLTEQRIQGEVDSGQFDLYNIKDQVLEDYKRVGIYKIKLILKGGIWKAGFEYVLQLNNYRLKLMSIGHPVKAMALWMCGKDYNFKDKREGLLKWNRFDVPFIRDSLVNRYFELKKRELDKCFKLGYPSYPCKVRERWGGRRCHDWCDVKHLCPLSDDEKFDTKYLESIKARIKERSIKKNMKKKTGA